MKRFLCWLKGHPNLRLVKEIGCTAEDVIAGTGAIHFSGWCDTCRRTVYWTESNV